MRVWPAAAGAVAAAALSVAVSGQSTATTYSDSRGRKVAFPLGDVSFADEVVATTPGKPAAEARFSDPAQVLGPPNFVSDAVNRKTPSSMTLGCAGTLTLRFFDNALVDVPGADLLRLRGGPRGRGHQPVDLARR